MQQDGEVMKHQILNLPETARKWSRAVAPVSAHRLSAATGRLRRSDEQQELWGNFVDKHVQENFGEEAAPAARRDVSGPITLFRSTAASRREPTGEMGAAALDAPPARRELQPPAGRHGS